MRLIDARDHPDAVETLWRLLEQRPDIACISHRQMPTPEEHRRFVESHPYTAWYLIAENGSLVGATYLSKTDEIGIAVFAEHQGHGYATRAIGMLVARHPRRRYLANINPGNEGSIKMFGGLGFRPLQVTYVCE